jgi:hypothetical protein
MLDLLGLGKVGLEIEWLLRYFRRRLYPNLVIRISAGARFYLSEFQPESNLGPTIAGLELYIASELLTPMLSTGCLIAISRQN